VLGALAAATVVVLGVELLSLVGWVRLGPMAALAVLSARALAAVYRSEAPQGRGSANADRLSRELVGNLVLIAASTPVTAVVLTLNVGNEALAALLRWFLARRLRAVEGGGEE